MRRIYVIGEKNSSTTIISKLNTSSNYDFIISWTLCKFYIMSLIKFKLQPLSVLNFTAWKYIFFFFVFSPIKRSQTP